MEKKTQNGFLLSDDFSKMDFDRVTQWLTATYWSPGIGREEVEEGARNSTGVVGAFAPDGQQVGYARLVSDQVRFAYLMDVFVEEKQRKRGLGRALVEFMTGHPDYRRVYLWLLATRDAHAVYRGAGFEPLKNPERWMAIQKGRPKAL